MPQNPLTQLLLDAVSSDQYKTAEALLKGGAGETWPNKGVDFLLRAIANNNQAMVLLLLRHHASLTNVNDSDKSPLIIAASQKKWGIVRLAVFDINRSDTVVLGRVLLMAIEDNDNDNEAIISMLLHLGADLNVTSNHRIALSMAADLKKWNIVKLIAENIASKRTPNKQLSTVTARTLVPAAENNQFDCVKTLLEAVTSPTFAQDQTTKATVLFYAALAFHYAVKNNNFEMASLLIEHDASVISKANRAYSTMQLAGVNSQQKMIAFIAEKKAALEKEETKIRKEIQARKHEQYKLAQLEQLNKKITGFRELILKIQKISANEDNSDASSIFRKIGSVYNDVYYGIIKLLGKSPNLATYIIELELLDKIVSLIKYINAGDSTTSPLKTLESQKTQITINEILKICEDNKTPLTKTIANLFTLALARLSYLERIHNLLLEMNNEIQNTTWKSTFLWTTSTDHPRHIYDINNLFLKHSIGRKIHSSSLVYLFSDIYRILSKIRPKKRRDPATQAFYDKYLELMQSLSHENPFNVYEKNVNSDAVAEAKLMEQASLVNTANLEETQTKTVSAQIQETSGMLPPTDTLATQNLRPAEKISFEKLYPTLDFEPLTLTTTSMSASTEPGTTSADTNRQAQHIYVPPEVTKETYFAAGANIPNFPPPTYEEHMQRLAAENGSSTSRAEFFPVPSAPIEEESDAPDAQPSNNDEHFKQSTSMIFVTVGLPSNEVQSQQTDKNKIKSTALAIASEQMPIESEEDKRVRLAIESLATMASVPKTQLGIFDREKPRSTNRSEVQQNRKQQTPLAS